jgi:tight adherence protein B
VILALATVAAVAVAVGVRVATRSRRRARWRRLLQAQSLSPVRATAVARIRAVVRWPHTSARWAILTGTAAGGSIGVLAAGPVAAVVLGAYGGAGLAILRRHQTRAVEAGSRQAAGDAVAALAAELRAGLPVGPVLAAAAGALIGPGVVGPEAALIARRVTAAVTVAESSGAPLADVLDRLDDHLRGVNRARASAAAQAAGARVSALLLAVLPIVGIGIGYAMGVDPLPILLGSRLGAVCLFSAVALQLAGLAWSGRLSRIEVAT